MFTSLEGVERIKTSGTSINPLNAELNTICHFLTLLGAHHIFHISRVRVKRKLTAAEKFRSIAVPLLAGLTVLAERKLFKISVLVMLQN